MIHAKINRVRLRGNQPAVARFKFISRLDSIIYPPMTSASSKPINPVTNRPRDVCIYPGFWVWARIEEFRGVAPGLRLRTLSRPAESRQWEYRRTRVDHDGTDNLRAACAVPLIAGASMLTSSARLSSRSG